MCCLRLRANRSYRQASEAMALFTGTQVSLKPQQRRVHRQGFSAATVDATAVSQLSLAGGNIRLLTPKGAPRQWRQSKALRGNGDGLGVAYSQANDQLCHWATTLPFAAMLYCLGAGQAGSWRGSAQMPLPNAHAELLDWYHLQENLDKVGGSLKRLDEAEALRWQGKVDATITLLKSLKKLPARKFCDSLRTHQQRMPHSEYDQAEGIPLGSGSVESWVKQIDRRTQSAGARWREEHVPQVLAHRCAYLNGPLDPISLSKK